MTDLRKAAEALRQALAHEALDRMVAENQRLGLYDAPPQKEWVGLTDADIAKAMHGSVEGSNILPYQFARTIEAKLKEKNT